MINLHGRMQSIVSVFIPHSSNTRIINENVQSLLSAVDVFGKSPDRG